MCLCIYGPLIFRFTPQDATCLSNIFDGLSPPVIMSNINTGSFTLGGSTPTCYVQHTIFIFKTVRLILNVVPCYRAHHRTPNIVSIKPCTHDIASNTKHSVNLYHALTPMSCYVLVHNAMQSCHCTFIPCYIYDECYMCIPTHALLPMHHFDIYIKKHTNSKYII